MKQSNIKVGKAYLLDDGEQVFIDSHCGVEYIQYIDEYDDKILVHVSRVVKEVLIECVKVWWIDCYGKLHSRESQPNEIEIGEYTSLEDLDIFTNKKIEELEKDLNKYKILNDNIRVLINSKDRR